MITQFNGLTANEAWLKAASFLQNNDIEVRGQASRAGMTKELLHAAFSIQDPLQRWVVSRQPAINPAFAIAEVVWILTGSNDAAFLKYWNSQLPKFVGNADYLHGAYGYRLRKHFGLDQLERAYLALHSAPDTRQVVLQIWDGTIDLPTEDGQAADKDIPCNIMSALKVRDKKLEWLQVMRSNDLFRGTPYNFIQFTTLQEVMAGWLGIEVGSYNHISDSLHFYESDYEEGRLDVEVEAEKNTDSLALPKPESEQTFTVMKACLERMMHPELQSKELEMLVEQNDLTTAYKNLLTIVAAQAARKRGWLEAGSDIAASCTNLLLIQASQRWTARFN
jgi:thymidylate synthase